MYGHFGPKTLRTRDISALVPKCPGHFGTSAERNVRETVLDILAPLMLRTQKCQINLFKKDYLLMTCFTFQYFLYTTSIKFFVKGNQHTAELAEPLFYHGDAKANSFIEANSFSNQQTAMKCNGCRQCLYIRILVSITVLLTMYFLNVDVDIEIRQAQAKPLSLLLTYTFLINVIKLQIKLTVAPGSVQFISVVIHKFLVFPKFI